MKKILIVSFTVLFFVPFLYGQTSGNQYHRSAVMDGNNIKTVIGNWGVIGQPGDKGPRSAWLYPTNGYIGDESILLGLELPIKDYNNETLQQHIKHQVEDLCNKFPVYQTLV